MRTRRRCLVTFLGMPPREIQHGPTSTAFGRMVTSGPMKMGLHGYRTLPGRRPAVIDADRVLARAFGPVRGIGREGLGLEIIGQTFGKPVQQIPGIAIDGESRHDILLDR